MKKPSYFSAQNPLLDCLRRLEGVSIIRLAPGMVLVFLLIIISADLLYVPAGYLVNRVSALCTEIWGIRRVDLQNNADDWMLFILFCTLIVIIMTLLYCRKVENRPLRTLGMLKQRLFPHYAAGALLGFAAFGGATAAAWALGALKFDGQSPDISWGTLGLLVLGWMIQGFSEEITFRGWLMTSLGAHHSAGLSLAVSSLLFAAMHLFNPGITVLAFCNLVLFGLFAGLYFLRTRNIWGIAAFHTVWNAVQGNFFGISVSGLNAGQTVFRFSQVSGHDWLNGGEFGMEGGLAVTAVLVTGILLAWFLPEPKYRPLEV